MSQNQFVLPEDTINWGPPPKDPKMINGAGKPKILNLPSVVLDAYHAVNEYGIKKYGKEGTWKNNEDGVTEYLNAAGRHILAIGDGENLDSESNLPHVYHILWNAVAAVWHYARKNASK